MYPLHGSKLIAMLGVAAIIVLSSSASSLAQSPPAVQRGFTLVRTNCAQCHSIDKVSPSPLHLASAFRTLHLRYPVESLAEALAEGIVTGHPTMPKFQIDPVSAFAGEA